MAARKKKNDNVKPVIPDVSSAPVLAAPTRVVKLDLAGGQNTKDGFECVDRWSGAQHVVDLTKFPWPFADNSVDELHCSHYIEHIPAREVERGDLVDPNGNKADVTRFVGKDHLFAFFDECYRILKKEGSMQVITPCARNNRAFQDPTHRRFIVAETFLYLAKEWRKMNKLDHYNVECDFAVNVVPTIPSELGLLSDHVQRVKFNESWNTIIDWYATLKPVK